MTKAGLRQISTALSSGLAAAQHEAVADCPVPTADALLEPLRGQHVQKSNFSDAKVQLH